MICCENIVDIALLITNYFTTFFQNVVMANFLLVFI